jgi:hypothetical protein
MPDVQIKLAESSELIDSYTADSVRRDWLVEQVDTLLTDPACRFVILIGDTGVRKPAVTAHLTATQPRWSSYFSRGRGA